MHIDVISVAPLAGAWIETTFLSKNQTLKLSRPSRARGLKQDVSDGDMILVESRPSRARGLKPACQYGSLERRQSRPSRARGLKRQAITDLRPENIVAPLAGAWIETSRCPHQMPDLMSRPSRARGLKRTSASVFTRTDGSRPSRARGLKRPIVNAEAKRLLVAPLAGAWIET